MSSPIHFYTVKVAQNAGGKGGAEGRVATLSEPNNSHFPKITVQSPQEFKGPKADDGKSLDWTPEDLFVSSVAVCFFTTFVAIAENSKLEYKTLEIVAKGKLEKVEGQGQIISEIEEEVLLKITDEKDREKALRVLEKVEKGCLIANSMKSKIIPKFNIVV
jgi:organic hydroperoxide reductase OsmC/OhrA